MNILRHKRIPTEKQRRNHVRRSVRMQIQQGFQSVWQFSSFSTMNLDFNVPLGQFQSLTMVLQRKQRLYTGNQWPNKVKISEEVVDRTAASISKRINT